MPHRRRIGEIYLDADEIAARVRELGAEIARDYAGREPLLVGALKACVPFVTDLSRAIPIAHALDFVELAGYGAADARRPRADPLPQGSRPRDRAAATWYRRRGRRHRPDAPLPLPDARRSASPSRSRAPTLFDRPYRRLVDDLPIRYVGFTVPDEFFAGYGFDLDERWRNLPDLHLVT